MYKVFIKYCVFSRNCLYFATSPSPALGCCWLYKNGQPIRVTVYTRISCEDELFFYMQGKGCSELGKNTNLNEYPVHYKIIIIIIIKSSFGDFLFFFYCIQLKRKSPRRTWQLKQKCWSSGAKTHFLS